MDFDTACQTEIPFGKYSGKNLWDILQKDPKYVDYMCGMSLYGKFKEALDVFVKNSDVSRKIDLALD